MENSIISRNILSYPFAEKLLSKGLLFDSSFLFGRFVLLRIFDCYLNELTLFYIINLIFQKVKRNLSLRELQKR